MIAIEKFIALTWSNPLYWLQWGQLKQFSFPEGTLAFWLQNQQLTFTSLGGLQNENVEAIINKMMSGFL